MRTHPRAPREMDEGRSAAPVLLRLLPLCAAVLLTACGDDSLPLDRPRPVSFRPTEVRSKTALASAPGFADQAGGGIFANTTGTVVRIRLDGSLGALAPHPGNSAELGTVNAVFRMGPHSALVEARNGLFLAESGWLISPPWRDALGLGITATTQSSDGAVWLAHPTGLFQLRDGTLSALKVKGEALTGITALAAAPTGEGSAGVWFLRDGKLHVAVATSLVHFDVREAGAPLEEGEVVESLAGLGPGLGTSGELWLLTNQGLLRRPREGWRRVTLPQRPVQLLASGRFLWVKSSDALLLYDADANEWGLAQGIDTREFRFLSADESGCAWVQLGGETVAVSRSPAPRVTGLHQGMQVVEDGLVVRAVMPTGVEPDSVVFQLGGVEVPAMGEGPVYSLGGQEADGTPKPYSFAGLEAGRQALGVVARFLDGTEAKRLVPFDYQPVSTVALSWATDIQPIHVSRCEKCHATGPGRALNTYELWKENAALITAAVRDQRMPADGPLDPQLISLIQRWAASGAKP
ncbi:hypothetical protein FJV41_07630 [Myxococcus llanfairpwllgwyngyllgogerychwyrndrobwllllantysiliogogogochensis]|uniref:Uncharacterized protein n=1 Tax=Myxococcus llanfairpwllgwyngyllgogerychwyrndrobwllllantysiliogogogochensis TaxID=2590453 RepID=A0A540X5U6_9BACT|nr:hypothetical protein [Myxococcus llanfairpwllgwyngyllgogerychwyrndrobwllllantysiliogogogochensis]TQF16570.1 hypothetical protein FJV41_07630 [Myxococcus llanfairpwllgwyngyllgogerychwyrndrobwllllantysiliogogogochensis]